MNKSGPQFIRFGKQLLVDKNKIIGCHIHKFNILPEPTIAIIYMENGITLDAEMMHLGNQKDFCDDVETFIKAHQNVKDTIKEKVGPHDP